MDRVKFTDLELNYFCVLNTQKVLVTMFRVEQLRKNSISVLPEVHITNFCFCYCCLDSKTLIS